MRSSTCFFSIRVLTAPSVESVSFFSCFLIIALPNGTS
jgi:hypothetical protein